MIMNSDNSIIKLSTDMNVVTLNMNQYINNSFLRSVLW